MVKNQEFSKTVLLAEGIHLAFEVWHQHAFHYTGNTEIERGESKVNWSGLCELKQ